MVKKKSIFPLTKLSDVVSMKSGESITAERITSEGKFPCFGGNGLRGYTTTFTHDGSYALVGRQGALCGNVTFVSGRFYASEHAIVVTPKKDTDIKFMSYVLYDMNLNQYSESSAQPGLSVKKLLELEYPIPTSKKGTARSFPLWVLFSPLIQICDDIITMLHGAKAISLLSCKGLCFIVICGVASLSIGLLEEYVWRGIVLNRFLSMWKKSKNGIWFSVLISSLFFGLCHYMNLISGQAFADTKIDIHP